MASYVVLNLDILMVKEANNWKQLKSVPTSNSVNMSGNSIYLTK